MIALLLIVILIVICGVVVIVSARERPSYWRHFESKPSSPGMYEREYATVDPNVMVTRSDYWDGTHWYHYRKGGTKALIFCRWKNPV